MHPGATGERQPHRPAFGPPGAISAREAAFAEQAGTGWSNEAEAPVAESGKQPWEERGDRAEAPEAARANPGTLPAVCPPNLERHWRAGDEGGVEFMRAALGVPGPAPQPRLRIAPPLTQTAGEPLPEAKEPVPGALEQDPQQRFRASVLLALTLLAVLLAAALAAPIR